MQLFVNDECFRVEDSSYERMNMMSDPRAGRGGGHGGGRGGGRGGGNRGHGRGRGRR